MISREVLVDYSIRFTHVTTERLLFCCDDLGYGDLGCYGAEYETPDTETLAANGVRFMDWHSTAPVLTVSCIACTATWQRRLSNGDLRRMASRNGYGRPRIRRVLWVPIGVR